MISYQILYNFLLDNRIAIVQTNKYQLQIDTKSKPKSIDWSNFHIKEY